MTKRSVVIIAFMLFSASGTAGALEYESFGKRDPFVPLIGVPQEPGESGVLSIYTIDDVNFGGTVSMPDGRHSVIINGEILREGQRRGRVEVLEIGGTQALIAIEGVQYRLRLYE